MSRLLLTENYLGKRVSKRKARMFVRIVRLDFMARYAFDLDGTLAEIPGIAELARDLIADGHKVFVITGNPSKADIKQKLDKLKIKPHKVIQVDSTDPHIKGEQKGHEANKHGISIFFEDRRDVMVGFAGTSRIARGLTPGKGEMQPVKRAETTCPCMVETRGEYQERRCRHCDTWLECAEMADAHRKRHHP